MAVPIGPLVRFLKRIVGEDGFHLEDGRSETTRAATAFAMAKLIDLSTAVSENSA